MFRNKCALYLKSIINFIDIITIITIFVMSVFHMVRSFPGSSFCLSVWDNTATILSHVSKPCAKNIRWIINASISGTHNCATAHNTATTRHFPHGQLMLPFYKMFHIYTMHTNTQSCSDNITALA